MYSEVKNIIKTSFNKSHATYDFFCDIQISSAKKIVDYLRRSETHFPIVADFACGTGICTWQLLHMIKFDKLYAIDFAGKLLKIAKHKLHLNKNIAFLQADYEYAIFSNNSINLITCNMGLQWSTNLKQNLSLFKSYLYSNGVLAVTIPLHGTFKELKDNYKNYSYTQEELEILFASIGLSILHKEIFTKTEYFNMQIDAIRSIKAVGANCSLNGTKASFAKISDVFLSKNDKSLTYKIGVYILRSNL